MTLHHLPDDRLPELLPLHERARLRLPTTRAVIERAQPGTACVDRPEAPEIALVAGRFGFAQALGAVDEDGAGERLVAAARERPELRGRYLLWFDPPTGARARLDTDGARRRERVRWRFDGGRFPGVPEAPAGATVEPVRASDLPDLAAFRLDVGGRFWPTERAFLERSLGVLVRVEGEAASLCYGAAVAGGEAEVDVATLEAFRGRGLALLAAAAFCARCRAAAEAPTWDCFEANEPSMRLARALGFVEVARYPLYSLQT